LTAKGFNLHQCKSKILGGLQSKIYSMSPVQTRDRLCGTLTFLCHANHVCDVVILFPTETVRIDLSARVFLSVAHVCFICAHSCSGLNFVVKILITDSSGSMNYSKRPTVSLNVLPMFENALTMFCNDFEMDLQRISVLLKNIANVS